jgi:hypothetical protein
MLGTSGLGRVGVPLWVGQRDQWHRRKQPSCEATARAVATLDAGLQIGCNLGAASLR